jgi:hypothetical protein
MRRRRGNYSLGRRWNRLSWLAAVPLVGKSAPPKLWSAGRPPAHRQFRLVLSLALSKAEGEAEGAVREGFPSHSQGPRPPLEREAALFVLDIPPALRYNNLTVRQSSLAEYRVGPVDPLRRLAQIAIHRSRI